jgi:hypothetical protein
MLEAIFLGVLQGLTEFLPISSSAHIRFAGELFGTNQDPGATFTAITQIGTELAVLIYFRKDILRIVKAWLNQITRQQLESSEKNYGQKEIQNQSPRESENQHGETKSSKEINKRISHHHWGSSRKNHQHCWQQAKPI